MIQRYIVIKDGIITTDYETSDGISGVKKAVKKQYDEIMEVPLWAETQSGRNIDEYTKSWRLKPLADRVAMGRVEPPEGFKIVGNEFKPKTVKDKLDNGELKIATGQKYNPETDNIEPMTESEMITAGIITQKEIDDKNQRRGEEELIERELRKMAIERLGDKLKVVKI